MPTSNSAASETRSSEARSTDAGAPSEPNDPPDAASASRASPRQPASSEGAEAGDVESTPSQESSRSDSYSQAHTLVPDARSAEIRRMLDLVNAQQGEVIVDYGCGTGVLTFPMAESVVPDGTVYAVEDGAGFISDEVATRCADAEGAELLIGEDGDVPLDDGSVDALCTLATLHHVPDKLSTFQEFARVLHPGGRLVIGDVARDTNVQRFFDEHVDEYCSTGHDLKFIGQRDLDLFCDWCSLDVQYYGIENVPWTFDSASQAGRYLTSIFDLSCGPDEALDRAKRYVGFSEVGSQFMLLWRLFFFVAIKRPGAASSSSS
jgi:SAM-dependent methyltransferase